MKRSLENLCIAATVSLVGSVMTLNWLVNDDVTQLFFSNPYEIFLDGTVKKIVKTESNGMVQFSIYLNDNATCEDIVDKFDFNNIPFRGKFYSPTCDDKNPNLITFEEDIGS